MPYSKTCKFITLGCIGVTAILVLVTIYSLTSSKCPLDGYLMHRKSKICYPKDSKGPCHHNLIFLEEAPKSQFGECSCPYTHYNRTMLYHTLTERCFYVFTQAYCDEGHWLSIVRNSKESEGLKRGSPICQKNPCLEGLEGDDDDEDTKDKHEVDYKNVEWVPIKGGGCAQLGTHLEGCPPDSKVMFHRGYILPSCRTPPITYKVTSSALGVPASSCALGSYPSITGKCQPDFDFDFE